MSEFGKMIWQLNNYELMLTASGIGLSYLLISVGGFLFHRSGKTSVLSFISGIVSIATTLTVLFLFERYLDIKDISTLHLVIWATTIVNVQNLIVLTVYYYNELQKKKPDVDHVTRKHFTSTLNTFMALLIMSLSFSVFLPTRDVILLLASSISIAVSIWINHLLTRLLLKDNRNNE